MRRPFAVVIAKIWPLIIAGVGLAAEPGDAGGGTERQWVRRFVQVAKVRSERLDAFREHVSKSKSALQPVLSKHHVKNHHLFMIELEPGEHYALRYCEYTSNNLTSDMRKLEGDATYKNWADEVDACLAGQWTDVECVFYTAGQERSKVAEDRVRHIGRAIGLRPRMAEPYVLLHAHTWPGVLAAIREGNIRNYSIFLAPIGAKMYLFAYLEYVGDDYDADMARIASDSDTKAWIKFTDEGCQLPLATRQPGEWWAAMERLSGE
jgi:L-rhamnose mutarotase